MIYCVGYSIVVKYYDSKKNMNVILEYNSHAFLLLRWLFLTHSCVLRLAFPMHVE